VTKNMTQTSSVFGAIARVLPKLMLGGAAALALLVLVATSDASAATKFGAKLTKNTQPSNSTPAHPCEPNPGKCTRVSMEAYGRPDGGEKAPEDGVIEQLRIIAGDEGSFRPVLAKAKPGQEKAKVTYRGSKLHYDGQGPGFNEPYKIEKYNVHIPVDEGEYLGIESKKTSMLRCSSGGPNQLLFQPPLDVGGPFEIADATDGCWLLMEAVYG
jgi:hypothetical protein